MTREQIQEIIFRVLSEQNWQAGETEKLQEVPVEVSARHVHLTEQAIEQLFGHGAVLTQKRSLSQPGQYLCEERVTLVTQKGRIEHVAVLGPARSAIQVELSLTDCRSLGIQAPLRISGDLSNAADVYILGPKGMITAKESVIVARAHIHITPAEAERVGITDGQAVSAAIRSERPVTLENVICRVSNQASLAMHIDFDEANGCALPDHAMAVIKTSGGKNGIFRIEKQEDKADHPFTFNGKLITEAVALKFVKEQRKSIDLERGVIVTPSAKDVLCHAGIEVICR